MRNRFAPRDAALLCLVTLPSLLPCAACYQGRLHRSDSVSPSPDAAPPSSPDAGSPPPPPTRDAGGPTPLPDAGSPDAVCGDERRTPLIYYGTSTPTYLPLAPEQVLAIGTFEVTGCSGTLIAPRWVLTAHHCDVQIGDAFCIGTDPAAPNTCIRIEQVANEPDGNDLTLLRLERDASERLPSVRPIPILTETMDASWVGRTAEAAGYGRQEDGSSGEREFTAEPIVEVGDPFLTIDGEGRHGVCFGDSGGPVMVISSSGVVRVAGALSYGDSSCVGRDRFTRTDLFADWIQSLSGPVLDEGASCGPITPEGRCIDGRAIWCEDGSLRAEDCPVRCGWSPSESAFRCIAMSDPCEGVDGFGRCEDGVAIWCEAGELRRRDCPACGERCVLDPDAGGANCEPDPCRGLDYLGRCNGDVAEYCVGGAFRQRDCAAEGLRCRWIDSDVGYWCG